MTKLIKNLSYQQYIGNMALARKKTSFRFPERLLGLVEIRLNTFSVKHPLGQVY